MKLSDIWKGESTTNIRGHISRHVGLQVWNATATFMIFKQKLNTTTLIIQKFCDHFFQQPASLANSSIFCCFPAHSCPGSNFEWIYIWHNISFQIEWKKYFISNWMRWFCLERFQNGKLASRSVDTVSTFVQLNSTLLSEWFWSHFSPERDREEISNSKEKQKI